MIEKPSLLAKAQGIGEGALGRIKHGFVRATERLTETDLAEQPQDTVSDSESTEDVTCQAPDSAALTKERSKKSDPCLEAQSTYNVAIIQLSDAGQTLLRQRERSADVIELVEGLVNSIANTPKSFERDFEEINIAKATFTDAGKFAEHHLEAIKHSTLGAGIGAGAGITVASLAPSAAMWAATTFGTASTGTAIGTLSGAAAQSAALAWLGGGALAAGGGGTAAGTALLALAGPIGLGIAGAAGLASAVIFTTKQLSNHKERQAWLLSVQRNIARVKQTNNQLNHLLTQTSIFREKLLASYIEALPLHSKNFMTLSPDEQKQLGSLVNNTITCAVLLAKRIEDGTSAHE
ncbi:MAG: hypothetical protein ACRDAX_08805 [Propionibacteriaceae bacterium]